MLLLLNHYSNLFLEIEKNPQIYNFKASHSKAEDLCGEVESL